jgi:chloramphenicol 3-O-phosphotransferase
MLNGGSSAGKTTLARTLQSALPEPWLLLGIDLLIWTLPPGLINDPRGLSVREGVITRGDIFMAIYTSFQKSPAVSTSFLTTLHLTVLLTNDDGMMRSQASKCSGSACDATQR